MCIFSPVHCRSAQGIIGVVLVQPVKLIQHGCPRCLQGWNTSEQIPETFEMIFHFTAAAHHIPSGWIENTITGTACNIHSFQNMNMRARHLTVTYKETCRCQRGKTTSYNIRIFLIHTLWLLGPCKSFIISVTVINTLAVLLILSTFRIAVAIILNRDFFHFTFFITLSLLCHNRRCTCTCCKSCCHTKFIRFLCHNQNRLSANQK